MRKSGGVLLSFFVCLCAVSVWAEGSFRTPFSNALERLIRNKASVAGNPGMGRLVFMRYYPPSDKMPEEDGFFVKLFGIGKTDREAHCTAVYLFNMYVSTAAYGEDVPSRLTTDYLGVLDSLGSCRTLYKAADAEKFYEENKQEIKKEMVPFFNYIHAAYNPEEPANDRRELAFMRLLARTPWYRSRPAYYASLASRLKGSVSKTDARFVEEQLRRSLAQNRNKVVTFERASVRGEDLDSKIGVKSSHVERTYRCVNDECEYCGYEMGKLICRTARKAPSGGREYMRVYKITAAPLQAGNSLRPARGNRFKLASGAAAAKWNYHTATLLVIKHNGTYAPVVADPFLAGGKTVSLNEWMKAFSLSNTMFYVVPFERSQEVEDAIKTVESRQGSSVRADGQTYTPAPISW